MYEAGEEVPLIGMNRKEVIGELNALRPEDLPEVGGGVCLPCLTVLFPGHGLLRLVSAYQSLY